MKHSRETFKVIVAETSLILRSGVVGAIRRSADSDVQFLEIENIAEFENRVNTYAPDVIIASPIFFSGHRITELRNRKDLGLTNTKFVALQSTMLDPNTLAEYDGVINIYDSSSTIHATLDKAMGYDEPEMDTEGEPLSQREKEIICEVVKGYTNKEIADRLNLSVFTILTHRRNIARKLQIHSSTALAIYAIANKLVSITDIK